MSDALIRAAEISTGSIVLDLASGSGDPALTIAKIPTVGAVIALDSSLEGLRLANAASRQFGLGAQFVCLQGDAHALPLTAGCIDRITCRCGIMFFRDTGLTLSEMLRVLKPGGRVAFLAWGPSAQPFFDATVGVVLQAVSGSEWPKEAQLMFRFAESESLEHALSAAGFVEAREISMTLDRIWAGAPEELWEYQQEVSTVCQPLFDAIPAKLRPEVDARAVSRLARFRKEDVLAVPVQVVISTAKKALR